MPRQERGPGELCFRITRRKLLHFPQQYGPVPGVGFVEVGGSGAIDAEGRQVHAPDEDTKPASLKAGESITIPAESFEFDGPYGGRITALAIDICYEGDSELSPDGVMLDYVFYFLGDSSTKAAIEWEWENPAFTGVPSWCANTVNWAMSAGITNGTGGGSTFSPGNTCTWGEIVTFLHWTYEPSFRLD